jgi:succinate dehydrogenase / fumarate reductase cytochrome b subunit
MPSHAPFDEVGNPWWVRLQRAIGLVPLSLFAVFHLWLNWPALTHRDAWLASVRAHALGTGIRYCVLALFGLHVVLGFVRAWRRRASSVGPSLGRARFQALSGTLLLAFLLYHLSHVWPVASSAAYAAVTDSYQQLWQLLGRPLPLTLYVFGCGALAFHLAHGWASAIEVEASSVALRGTVRYVAGALGLVLFVLYMQLVGRFALGEAVVPMERAEARQSASE